MKLLLLPFLLAAAAAPVPAFEPGPGAPGFRPRTTPEAAGIAPARLQRVLAAAKAADSDALIVLRDGKVLAERYFHGGPRPLPAMSISKAVASLAIGMLVDDGTIASIDLPMSTWLPEWAADPRKSRVTLRHVLTHTSGVGRQMMGGEIYSQPDYVAFARALPAGAEPGSAWVYNNAVLELIAEVVRQAAGMPLDAFLEARLFEPLGVTATFGHDDRGNPDVFGGLVLTPRDLATIGLLIQQDGVWAGRRLISHAWLVAASTPADGRWAHQGLAFTLGYPGAWSSQTRASREGLRAYGLGALADKLAPFDDRPFANGLGAYGAAVRSVATPEEVARLNALWAADKVAPLVAHRDFARRTLEHTGWLGQFLMIDPAERIVGVRFYARRGESMEAPGLLAISEALRDLASP